MFYNKVSKKHPCNREHSKRKSPRAQPVPCHRKKTSAGSQWPGKKWMLSPPTHFCLLWHKPSSPLPTTSQLNSDRRHRGLKQNFLNTISPKDMALCWHAFTWGFSSASQNCYLSWHCTEGQSSLCLRHGEAASSHWLWRHESSRKLLRAQLTRPLLKTRTSVTADLGWDIVQVGTRTVRSLGNSSGIGGDRGWVMASLHLLESFSPLNEWSTLSVLPWRLSEAYQWNDKTKNETLVQLGAGVAVIRESEQCISRSTGLNGAKWNQVELLLLVRVILQDLAGKLFPTAAMDRMLIPSPALTHWHFASGIFSCLLKHGANLPPSPGAALTSAPHSRQRRAGSFLLARGVKPM